MNDHTFVSSMLSRANTKVAPAQLATAGGLADTFRGGIDMGDGRAAHEGVRP